MKKVKRTVFVALAFLGMLNFGNQIKGMRGKKKKPYSKHNKATQTTSKKKKTTLEDKVVEKNGLFLEYDVEIPCLDLYKGEHAFKLMETLLPIVKNSRGRIINVTGMEFVVFYPKNKKNVDRDDLTNNLPEFISSLSFSKYSGLVSKIFSLSRDLEKRTKEYSKKNNLGLSCKTKISDGTLIMLSKQVVSVRIKSEIKLH